MKWKDYFITLFWLMLFFLVAYGSGYLSAFLDCVEHK